MFTLHFRLLDAIQSVLTLPFPSLPLPYYSQLLLQYTFYLSIAFLASQTPCLCVNPIEATFNLPV